MFIDATAVNPSGVAYTNSYGLTVNAQTGSINSYTAQFLGGNVGFRTSAPTAYIHLGAGTASASTAPLKFTSGTLNTTAEAGAVEFLTDNLHLTITTGAARKGIMLDDGARLTSGMIPKATTNGRLIDGYTFYTATATLDFGSTIPGGATDLTIALTGAAIGNPVILGLPDAVMASAGTVGFQAWVSATDVVKIRFENDNLVGNIDPASASYTVSIIK